MDSLLPVTLQLPGGERSQRSAGRSVAYDPTLEMNMSILTSRTKLHSLAVIVAFGTLAFLANAASARAVQIGGTHSKAEIGAKCATTGGMTEHGKGGGYGCFNQNKGTSVDCDAKGHCVGWVPGRVGPGGSRVGNILGGSNVQTDPVKPKTAPKETTGLGPGKTGDVKQAGANNQRGPRVVRDHRGEQPKWGAPDRPRHQPLGGSSGGHPNGPPSIVRDHRK